MAEIWLPTPAGKQLCPASPRWVALVRMPRAPVPAGRLHRGCTHLFTEAARLL